MRYRFSDIFRKNLDGSLSPIKTVHVNGVTFGYGITFKEGVAFGGIDFFKFENNDIDAEEVNGIFDVKGFYNQTHARARQTV
jgi:hypothetical protein